MLAELANLQRDIKHDPNYILDSTTFHVKSAIFWRPCFKYVVVVVCFFHVEEVLDNSPIDWPIGIGLL